MGRPELTRVPEFFHNYINQVKEDDLGTAFKTQSSSFARFLEQIPADKTDHAYDAGKWTIKEILQHIIDSERIFSYRALCFARKDLTPLPGFDENIYAENAKTANRKWEDLIEEYKMVRKTSEILFNTFDEEQLESSGNVNDKSNYVKAIGFIIVGHVNHHQRVIKERYL